MANPVGGSTTTQTSTGWTFRQALSQKSLHGAAKGLFVTEVLPSDAARWGWAGPRSETRIIQEQEMAGPKHSPECPHLPWGHPRISCHCGWSIHPCQRQCHPHARLASIFLLLIVLRHFSWEKSAAWNVASAAQSEKMMFQKGRCFWTGNWGGAGFTYWQDAQAE